MIIRKPRKKTSLIWTIPTEELTTIVKKSNSISDILKLLGYGPTGGTHDCLKQRIKADNIDISHIKLGNKSNLGRKFDYRLTWDECIRYYFIPDKSTTSNSSLRFYIKLYKLIEYKCKECGIENLWNNKPISLQLDHINGIKTDNRLENLRFLCPNCHSQTETFGSKNIRKKLKIIKYCNTCKIEVGKYNVCGLCRSCKQKSTGKIEQSLNKDEIKELVWKYPLTEVAKQLNYSANGIKKFCHRHNINIPKGGYWTRRNAGQSHEQALNPIRKIRINKKSFTKEQVAEIKSLLLDDKISLRAIARKFNVDHKTIISLRDGKTYLHYNILNSRPKS